MKMGKESSVDLVAFVLLCLCDFPAGTPLHHHHQAPIKLPSSWNSHLPPWISGVVVCACLREVRAHAVEHSFAFVLTLLPLAWEVGDDRCRRRRRR